MQALKSLLAGVAVGIALIVLLVPVAQAAPSGKLAKARDAFRRGEYAKAMPPLNYLLYPKPRLSRRADLAEAHLMLGVCYFETGNADEAGAEFDRALRQQADLELDPLFASEKAVEYFRERKEEFKKKAAEDEARRRLAEENALLRAVYERGLVRERRPYYVNFIPFGAGQFQNDQTGKGIFFSVAQAVTGGASMLIFGFHAAKYGFGGSVPREEADGVRLLQQIQVGAGIGFLGFVAWGIVDSLINYQPYVQVEFDESLLQQLKPKKPADPTSLRLTPTPLPGGAGVTLSWGF